MSADNWAICPACKKRHDNDIAKREADIDTLYGQVPVAEFDASRELLNADRAKVFQPTFREDYEFYGVEEGEVTATYRGACQVCSLSLKFEHTHALDVDGAL